MLIVYYMDADVHHMDGDVDHMDGDVTTRMLTIMCQTVFAPTLKFLWSPILCRLQKKKKKSYEVLRVQVTKYFIHPSGKFKLLFDLIY